MRVHPTVVPLNHPLAGVRGSFNAVMLTGDFVDDIMLYGRGAGARPTGSAIVSDVLFCSKQCGHAYFDFGASNKTDGSVEIVNDFKSKYYISLTTFDRAGVLASVSKVLAEAGVSISTVLQKGSSGDRANITFLTHEANEKAVTAALGDIEKLEYVRSIDSLIRCL